MAREVTVAEEALVIRFSPFSAERVLKSARNEFSHNNHHHGSSVYADVARDGETEDALIRRLAEAAGLGGINLARNPKLAICAPARNLLGDGFRFLKDEYSGELPEHYCVNLGTDEPALSDVERFLAQFDRRELTPT